jgi:hemerythrin
VLLPEKRAHGLFAVCKLGDQRLDSQHELLFGIAAGLQEALHKEGGDAVVGDYLERLLAYMAFHFATEDRMMSESDYPDADTHRREHAAALTTARRLDRAFRSGKKIAAVKTLAFIEKWATEHIPCADRALSAYLHNMEQKARAAGADSAPH